MKVGSAIIEILKREGVDTIYGYPLSPITEFAAAANVRPIVTRAERTAIHMADAVSRTTSGRKIGVVYVQYGPGIENAMGAIAQAYTESVPMLVIPTGYPRRQAQLDGNFSALTGLRSISKSVESLIVPTETTAVFRRAFSRVRNGRGGPVVVEVPWDVWQEETAPPDDYVPALTARYAPDSSDVERAVDLILEAKNPLLYVGQGVHYGAAWAELRELAEWLALPVMTTLEGKSAFPESHPLSLGAGGRAMTGPVRHYLRNCDLVIGIGCSFTESPYAVKVPAGVPVIQATLDPNHLNKDVRVSAGLVGDARLTLRMLLDLVKRRVPTQRSGAAAKEAIAELRSAWLAKWDSRLTSKATPISPYRVVSELQQAVDIENTIVTHDAGHPRDQIATFWQSKAPLTYLGWGKTTQLGYGLGLAMGAKMAHPDKLCINFWGDSAFGFTGLELETAVREKIPVMSILVNNSCMATELEVMAGSGAAFGTTNVGGSYAEIGQALGAYAERVTDPSQVGAAIRRGIAQTKAGRPVLLEFITDRDITLSHVGGRE